MNRTLTVRRALAGALLVAALSGCASAGQPGTAAVVDGRDIAVSDLQQATEEIQRWTEGPVDQAKVLYFLIIGPQVAQAAAGAGVGVSPDDARVSLASKVPDPSATAIAAVQANEAIGRIGQLAEDKRSAALDSIVSSLKSTSVSVNPRYGRFDATAVQLNAAEENWLVAPPKTPAATAPASPSP